MIENNFIIKYNEFIETNIDKENKILEFNQTNHKGRVIVSNSEIRDWKIIFNGNNEGSLNGLSENNLTGCLTFIKSKIEDLIVNVKNVHCEDAINFINSKQISLS